MAKKKIPHLRGLTENYNGDEVRVRLWADTAKLKKQIGKEEVAAAFLLAGEAVVVAIKQSISDLGFVRSGRLLGSVGITEADADHCIVGFRGGRLKDNRNNAEVAFYLNEEYGLVDYAEYLAPAQIAWKGALSG